MTSMYKDYIEEQLHNRFVYENDYGFMTYNKQEDILQLEEIYIEPEHRRKGLASKFSDFEDALQYHCAIKMACNILITRNGKGFKESDIPVMTPDEYLKSLKSK